MPCLQERFKFAMLHPTAVLSGQGTTGVRCMRFVASAAVHLVDLTRQRQLLVCVCVWGGGSHTQPMISMHGRCICASWSTRYVAL